MTFGMQGDRLPGNPVLVNQDVASLDRFRWTTSRMSARVSRVELSSIILKRDLKHLGIAPLEIPNELNLPDQQVHIRTGEVNGEVVQTLHRFERGLEGEKNEA